MHGIEHLFGVRFSLRTQALDRNVHHLAKTGNRKCVRVTEREREGCWTEV